MMEQASPQERERRRALCNACPHLVTVGRIQFKRCGKCQCPLFTKTRFQGTSCPVGKW